MRVNSVSMTFNYASEKDSSALVQQGSIISDKLKRSGAVLTGLDLAAYEMCVRGTPSTMDVQRLRDLLSRIGR